MCIDTIGNVGSVYICTCIHVHVHVSTYSVCVNVIPNAYTRLGINSHVHNILYEHVRTCCVTRTRMCDYVPAKVPSSTYNMHMHIMSEM